ncbi:MAG: hypothetical protein D6E12_16995 [Desulfovibrio sp.]|nr:MAG: hypothetical protein D6E12_16995 [Desulfovibrio sp.]
MSRLSLFAIVMALLLAGCSSAPPAYTTIDPPPGSTMLDGATYAADALHANLWNRLGPYATIVAVNLVNLDDLEDSSGFGRVVSQQVASRLAQYGYWVVEGRIQDHLSYRPHQGEFLLTREAGQLLMNEYSAQAALVGSYSVTSGKVFVSVRVVNLEQSTVVAAYEYWLRNGGETSELLASDNVDPQGTWERLHRRPSAFEEPQESFVYTPYGYTPPAPAR